MPDNSAPAVESDEIRIDLVDDDLEPVELEQAVLALRGDLLELEDVSRVSTATSGPAPDGSRAVGIADIGSLVVAAKPTIEVVARVVAALRSWLGRRQKPTGATPQTLKITVNGHSIELSPTAEQQADLVEEFLRTLAASGPTEPPPSG